MYFMYVYIPETHLDSVKDALFSKGAGKLGKYAKCCWQVKGDGQFLPLDGSDPHIGQQGQIETVEEYRVELVFEEKYKDAILKALKESHPYEEPAFGIIKLEN